MERLAPSDRRLDRGALLNVRDLGGLTCEGSTLQPGRLVRSSMLGTFTPAGRDAIRTRGIRTVIDLRTAAEVAESPSPFSEGLTYRHVPFTAARAMSLHRAAAEGTMSDGLRRLAVASGGLGAAVGAIADSNLGILIHCLAGRDRTGIVVAVTLAAIGVPDEDIVADYVASNAELGVDHAQFSGSDPDTVADVDAAIEQRAWTMQEVLTTLRLAFGGAGAYLGVAGVTAGQIEAIRSKLLR